MAVFIDPELLIKKEKVQFAFEKKGVTSIPPLRFGSALDISYSMKPHIDNGSLQKKLNQIMGVGLTVDDNGEADIFKFDDHCEFVDTCSPKQYKDFVAKHGIRARGGTSYSPVIEAVRAFYYPAVPKEVVATPKASGGIFKRFFGLDKTEAPAPHSAPVSDGVDPVLFTIVTDGEPGDYDQTRKALTKAEKDNIYFHFVGVGSTHFPTITRLADEFPNVGSVIIPHFNASDEEVYAQLICDELITWIARFGGNSTNLSASA